MAPRGKKRTRSVAALEAVNTPAKIVKAEEDDAEHQPQPEASGSGDKDARIRELEAKVLELSQLAPGRHTPAHGKSFEAILKRSILIMISRSTSCPCCARGALYPRTSCRDSNMDRFSEKEV